MIIVILMILKQFPRAFLMIVYLAILIITTILVTIMTFDSHDSPAMYDCEDA